MYVVPRGLEYEAKLLQVMRTIIYSRFIIYSNSSECHSGPNSDQPPAQRDVGLPTSIVLLRVQC